MDPIEYTMNYPETLLGGPQEPAQPSSELAPPKPAGPAKVVAAVATGSGAVPASELFLLADLWETRFRDRRLDAEHARNHHEYRRASELTQESLAYKTAFTELRQLVAYQDRRQPLLNALDELHGRSP